MDILEERRYPSLVGSIVCYLGPLEECIDVRAVKEESGVAASGK